MYSNKAKYYGKKNYDELIDLLNNAIEKGYALLDDEHYYVDFRKDDHVVDDAWLTQDFLMMAMNKTSIWLSSEEAKQIPTQDALKLFMLYDRCRRLSELYLQDYLHYYQII